MKPGVRMQEKLLKKLRRLILKIIELGRFGEIELGNVIDSIFKPNKFSLDLKKSLIQKSDGVIYILLQYLKHLHDKNFFILDEGEIWAAKTTDEFQNVLNAINFNNVLKNNVGNSLKILDTYGLGIKARNLIRYLCFQDISYDVLRCVLELDSHSLQYILDIFERDYIIKKQNDIYAFHHQLKKDYCEEKLLPDNIKPDYITELAMCYENQEKRSFNADIFVEFPYLNDLFRNLNEPHLEEKIHFLFNVVYYPDSKLDVLYAYKDRLSKEKMKDYLDYVISIINDNIDLYPIAWIDEVEDLCSEKNIDKLDSLYFDLKDSEYNGIAYEFSKKCGIEPKDYRTFLPIYKISKKLFEDSKLIEETYNKLDNISVYFELDFEKNRSDWNLFRLQDLYKSIIHITGLLVLTIPSEKERYIKEYIKFFDKLFSLPNISVASYMIDNISCDFIIFHYKRILKDYPETLNKVSSFIYKIACISEENIKFYEIMNKVKRDKNEQPIRQETINERASFIVVQIKEAAIKVEGSEEEKIMVIEEYWDYLIKMLDQYKKEKNYD